MRGGRSKWRGINEAGEAGRGMGQAVAGIGEGLYRAFNEGKSPDQVLSERMLLDEEKRREQMQIGREDRGIRNQLLLDQALGNLGGIVSPELSQMRQTAMDQGGVPSSPTVRIAGMEIDPGLAAQHRRERERQLLADEIEKEKAKRAALPTNNQFVGFMGNTPMQYNPRTGTMEPVTVGGGIQVNGPLDAKTKTGSSRGLTENAKLNAVGLAGKHGVNINDPKYQKENGDKDWMAITYDARQNETKLEIEARNKKLESSSLTTDQKNKVKAYQAVQNDLTNLKQNIKELSDSGKLPGVWENAISVAANQPPDGFFSALVSGGAKLIQSEEAKELEGNKAMVATALTNAISGAAVPDNERAYLTPFLPQGNDTGKDLLIKVAGLERYLAQRVNNYSQPVSGQTGVATQGQASTVTAPKTASDYLNKFK
jgi:hypothetical protein